MSSPVRAHTKSKHAQSILPVLLHVEEHLEEQITLDELAAIAGFAPHHFHRIFKGITGETPKEYMRRLRLERAVYRLKANPDSVLRIALESGFATHETFTRAFMRRFHVRPSEFRSTLRAFREYADTDMGSRTFTGLTEETPLTLRFDLHKEPLSVVRTRPRHLLIQRHFGYETLLDAGRAFLNLWHDLLAYADHRKIRYSTDTLIGITHDDPYVTDESRIRYDACIPIEEPVQVEYPFAYRYLPSDLCVVRRHDGGLEEIAKTFAYIGVDWMLTDGYNLKAAPPFEVYHCARTLTEKIYHQYTEAFVPLEYTPSAQEDSFQ